jgi:hypothetical protein
MCGRDCQHAHLLELRDSFDGCPLLLFAAGIVTTLVTPEQTERLLSIGRELGLSLAEQPVPTDEALEDAADPEAAKRALDDLFNLL